MNPTIEYPQKKKGREIHLELAKRRPLCNLYFMRDQQFLTDHGLILSRMASATRRGEVAVTKFLWEEVLHVPIAYEMLPPATIEGGEFIPMGDFALVGIGSRTNREAIKQLLSLDFEYTELAVVHQPMHPLISATEPDPMVNMHLDTYFNVVSDHIVVGSELLLKNAKVEIYIKEEEATYVKQKKEMNLHAYIKSKGFEIINITSLEQLSYASNFLCIKNGSIMAIEVEHVVDEVMHNLERKAKRQPARYGKLFKKAQEEYEQLKNEGQFFPHKKEIYLHGIHTYPVILKNLTGGFGGAHCMTCALSRGS